MGSVTGRCPLEKGGIFFSKNACAGEWKICDAAAPRCGDCGEGSHTCNAASSSRCGAAVAWPVVARAQQPAPNNPPLNLPHFQARNSEQMVSESASETRTPLPALIGGHAGGGVMFQWNTRIAACFIVFAALLTTAVAQPQKQGGKPGGAPAARHAPAAPAPHVAPAPRAAPAPHASSAPCRTADGCTARCARHRCTACRSASRRSARCAAHRCTTPRAASRRTASSVGSAPRRPAAACPSIRRPDPVCCHTAWSADAAANLRGSYAAAASQRPQCRRRRRRATCPTERKSGAAARAGRRFRRGTARRPQRRSTTKPRSATRSESAKSGEPRRSTICPPRPSS